MSTPKPTRGALLLVLALLASGAWAPLSSQEAGEKEKEKPKAAETSKKKKKKKKSTAGSEPGSRKLSTRKVLSQVLRRYQTGFESLSVSSVSDGIDAQRFYDYPRFEEGVTVFLQSVGELRLFTREVSVQVEGDRAVMIVDAEMVFARRDTPSPRERRTSQITFDFQRTPRGWKITEIKPRSFFLP
ncbi:MAG: hypothetical protein ACE5MH_00120 [Terriglobia bacterium]